jgi:competence protein ComEC
VSSAADESSSAISSSAPESSAPVSAAPAAAPTSGTKLKVHYIDVGQGDSEFIELPNGKTILIDAGNPENGQQIISYIKGLKHDKIDYLVATHPHADHIGGMAAVINSFNIGSFYAPKVTTTTQTYKSLISALQSKKLGIHVAKAGTNMFKAGNLSADIIAPVSISGDDLNQYSAVIMLTYGDNRFLFTGDAGEPSESQITADVKADVLKVGHHGSSTSTSQAFLNKVKPKYAVIEVGTGNSYGHPTAATLSKLQAIGATIYRTDKDGTIIFTSDSHTITVDKKASGVKENAPPKASSKAATAKSTTPKAASPLTDNQSVTVYITDTGSKYHRAGCKYLKKSKHAISLKDAKAQGYGPCGICNPPQ